MTTTDNLRIDPAELVVGARILVTGGSECTYGTITRMDLPRLGFFAYDSPTGGPSSDQAMFHALNVIDVIDLWAPLTPVDGYCCVDAHASRDWQLTLHTGGCSWRCRRWIPVTHPRWAAEFAYPCGRTVCHDGDCWVPERYR